jgi:hypothetical protein
MQINDRSTVRQKPPAWLKPDPQAQPGGYGWKAQQPKALLLPGYLGNRGNPQIQPGGYGYQGNRPDGLDLRAPVNPMPPPAWLNRPLPSAPRPTYIKPNMPAGYYQTGPEERKTVMVNGQEIRLGPNSTLMPSQTPANFYDRFMNMFNNRRTPSGVAGVRG